MPSPKFSRFNKAMAAVNSAMQQMAGLLREAALEQIGGYRSRGHGKGTVTYARSRTVAQAKRIALKARNIKLHKSSRS